MRNKFKKNSMDSCVCSVKRLLVAAAAALIMTGCSTNTQAVSEPEAAQESADPQALSAGENAAGAGTENAAAGDTNMKEAAGTANSSVQAQSEADASDSEEETVEIVTVVIPTVYENVTTQQEADEIRDKNGYESAVLEEDGSLRIEMSRSQYDEILRQFRESVDEGISEIVSQGAGSTIEKIEYNEDYSVFTVTVSGNEIGIIERQTADELVMYGTLYHVYTGNDTEHIEVNYISRESGEIIESADSGSLDQAY